MGPRGQNCIVFKVALLLSLGGAQGVLGQSPSDVTGGAVLIPAVDLPSELARVLRDYERHWSAGEAEALAALFVEDGLIVRGGSWIRGRAAIREAYENASGPLRLRAIEYSAGEAVGFIVGTYGYGADFPAEEAGMFVLTLRRDMGRPWLIVSDLDRGAN